MKPGKIILLATLTLICAGLTIHWPLLSHWLDLKPDGMFDTIGKKGTGIALFLTLAFTSRHIIHRLLDFWSHKSAGIDAPKLLKDLSALGIWILTIVLIMAKVFAVDVGGLLTASSVVLAVIGFALRSMIADIFTGISLAMERPLKTGDWLKVDGHEPGKVVETNWRATKLVTLDEYTVVVPNNQLASRPFLNYNRPEIFFRTRIFVLLSYDITSHQAERILLSAISQVKESASIPRKPDVRISEFKEHGVLWELRFWVPDYQGMTATRYEIQRRVLRNLHYAGCVVPPKSLEIITSDDVVTRKSQHVESFSFFRQIDLFEQLSLEEFKLLNEKCVPRLFLKGNPVVRQGDQGDSLFLVKEGMLNVVIATPEGKNITVGHLIPGSFFGEMSLLTGSSRSASVVPDVDSLVQEITKEMFRPLLENRPELMEALSATLAQRQAANQRMLQSDKPPVEQKTLAHNLLQSIRSFFGFSKG